MSGLLSFGALGVPGGTADFAQQGFRTSTVRFGETEAGILCPNPMVSYQDVVDSLNPVSTARESPWVYEYVVKINKPSLCNMLQRVGVEQETALCDNAAWWIKGPYDTDFEPVAVRGEQVTADNFIVIYFTKIKTRRDRTRQRVR